jgi:TonB family protein
LSHPIFHDRKIANLLGISVVGLISIFLLFVPMASAQKADKLNRRVIARVQPDYPRILKNAQIGGVVRLNATVLANGTVTKVVILGGNPILAESAMQAVMRWKFVASASQTQEELILNFDPRYEP